MISGQLAVRKSSTSASQDGQTKATVLSL